MTFINERISDEDKARIDFSRIKRPPLYLAPIEPYDWTIDRERNVFLIWTLGGNEDERHAEHFAFWWDGDVIPVKLEADSVGRFAEHVTTTWRLKKLAIPAHLEPLRDEIVRTLKDALTEYKVDGIGVPVASHEARFEF